MRVTQLGKYVKKIPKYSTKNVDLPPPLSPFPPPDRWLHSQLDRTCLVNGVPRDADWAPGAPYGTRVGPAGTAVGSCDIS